MPPNWALRDWQEELLAQARAVAWEAYLAYNPASGVPLEAFVFIKVREALRTYWRKEWKEALHRATPPTDGEEGGENWEFTLLSLQQEEKAWKRALIRWALSWLSAKERFVIERLFGDGWTEAEIAQGLGISQQAVSKVKRQALQKLREMLS